MKTKAKRYGAFRQLKGSIASGFINNITDVGSPVKGSFKKQTDTLQFKRWFGKSENVDSDGQPIVFYHNTNEPITKINPDYGKDNRFSNGQKIVLLKTQTKGK